MVKFNAQANATYALLGVTIVLLGVTIALFVQTVVLTKWTVHYSVVSEQAATDIHSSCGTLSTVGGCVEAIKTDASNLVNVHLPEIKGEIADTKGALDEIKNDISDIRSDVRTIEGKVVSIEKLLTPPSD